MDLILESKIVKVKAINKKHNRTPHWVKEPNLNVGEKIKVELNATTARFANSPEVKIYNLNNDNITTMSIDAFSKNIWGTEITPPIVELEQI